MKNTSDLAYLEYIEEFITANRRDNFINVLKNRTRHFTIAIEDVFQLHNTSAVMRTCEVFGIQDLNVIEEKLGKTIDKEIALGAQKWVDVTRHQSTQQCIDTLRGQGYSIIATSPHNDSCYLEDFDITKPAAIFFGTEKLGLTETVLNQADGFLKIAMVGFTESINISSSAAIIIQALTTRLRNSGVSWQLSDMEMLEKRIDWTRKSIKDIDFITRKYLEQD